MNPSLPELAASHSEAIERADSLLMARIYLPLYLGLMLAGHVTAETGIRSGESVLWAYDFFGVPHVMSAPVGASVWPTVPVDVTRWYCRSAN